MPNTSAALPYPLSARAHARDISQRLNDIAHQYIDLRPDGVAPEDNHPHRPVLSLWADYDSGNECARVVMGVGSLWSQGQRFVEMTPDEARRLAAELVYMARRVDDEVRAS